MKRLLILALSIALLSGCISNRNDGNLTINLYGWADQSTPLTSRTTNVDEVFGGYFTGDTDFRDVLKELPELDTSADAPYLLEICADQLCEYLVVFPRELVGKENGNVTGYGAMNALSTALYYDVKSLPASEVRDALDELAQQILSDEIETLADGEVDYADLFGLDYQRFTDYNDLFIDSTLTDRAEAALALGGMTTASELIDDEGGNGSQSELITAWILNEGDERSDNLFESGSTQGVLVNVQSVSESGSDFVEINATGIPDYSVTITQALFDWLSDRPRSSSDFVTGQPAVSVGQVVKFGEDIGYSSNNDCQNTGGYGYWPPGPVCPEDVSHVIVLPLEPEPTTTECDTGIGSVGYYVNGTSVYNWTDAQSYNNEGVWYTLAPVAEVYDVDICGGHAANGDYHHHFYSECLAELVGDEGDGHSPLYGFAADGYPIYGPWQNDGTLARSSWVARDYDNAGSASGCGEAGVRSSLLVDQYDLSAGTESADANGPTTSGTYTSMSQNTFTTESGFFFEDWYYDASLSARGDEYLDEYNGHSHDELGYHYHVTIEFDGDAVVPAFPYSVGPRYAGELQEGAPSSCSTGLSGPGGGPPPMGGGPPGG